MSRLNKRTSLLLMLFALLAGLLVACGPDSLAPAGSSTTVTGGGITVIGQGEAFGTPDQANIQIGVETFAETVSAATSQNETSVNAILAALAAQGIAKEDIQTSNYSLWAEQIYGDKGPEGIAGYRVTNQVNVTVRNIDKVGDVIAAATEAGANNVGGVYFSVADPAGLEAEARAAAIADAQARAASLASLSGVELGQVISVSEVIGVQPLISYDRVEAAAGMGGAPSIEPGQLSYTMQVQLTYAIK